MHWREARGHHGELHHLLLEDRDAQRALEASPGHYENMVNPAFNQVGIGITVRNGITYVVQVFVSR